MAECVAAVTMYNYQDVLYGTGLLLSHSQNSVSERNIAFSESLCLRSSTKTQTQDKAHGNLFLRFFTLVRRHYLHGQVSSMNVLKAVTVFHKKIGPC